MIRIAYKGYHKNLRLAVNNVNNLLQQEYFYRGIERHKAFDMADIAPARLASLMRIADITITVDLYYSLFPFSNMVVADNADDPFTIRVNKWNLNGGVEVLCNALMHQCVHAVNACFPQFSFGHGDDKTNGKENTAPYWIATLAEKHIATSNMIYEAMADGDVSGLPFLQQFTDTARKRPAYMAAAK